MPPFVQQAAAQPQQNQMQGQQPAQAPVQGQQQPTQQQPAQQQQQPTAANNIFKPPQQAASANSFFAPGSLLQFRYSFWIHDPAPLVIVSSSELGHRISGVNLHYLTYPVISEILSQTCTTKTFAFANYKANHYISGAFRTYKWGGVSQIKKMDCEILLRIISGVRSLDPSQVQAIQQSVEDQLRRPTNPVVNAQQEVGTVATVGTVGQTSTGQNNNQGNDVNGGQ